MNGPQHARACNICMAAQALGCQREWDPNGLRLQRIHLPRERHNQLSSQPPPIQWRLAHDTAVTIALHFVDHGGFLY
jgi:hypothetical protein